MNSSPDLGDSIPRHVAVIMDGNGRWAQKRHFGRVRGHRAGVKAVRATVAAALDAGVRYLTLFAFSSENWGRPKPEVNALMGMLAIQLIKEVPDLASRGVRVRVIGERELLPPEAQRAIAEAENRTAHGDKLDMVLALSYGGRGEIVAATARMLREGVDPDTLNEETFSRYLYAPDIPDPDLLIRTSGEMRLSNFLLWQIAYTEFYVTETLWPDFGPEEFRTALGAYAQRSRRFGLTEEQSSKGNT